MTAFAKKMKTRSANVETLFDLLHNYVGTGDYDFFKRKSDFYLELMLSLSSEISTETFSDAAKEALTMYGREYPLQRIDGAFRKAGHKFKAQVQFKEIVEAWVAA